MKQLVLTIIEEGETMTGFNYKIIVYQMEGCKFETPLIRKFKMVRKWILIALISVAFTLSVIATTKWFFADSYINQGIVQTMNAKNAKGWKK